MNWNGIKRGISKARRIFAPVEASAEKSIAAAAASAEKSTEAVAAAAKKLSKKEINSLYKQRPKDLKVSREEFRDTVKLMEENGIHDSRSIFENFDKFKANLAEQAQSSTEIGIGASSETIGMVGRQAPRKTATYNGKRQGKSLGENYSKWSDKKPEIQQLTNEERVLSNTPKAQENRRLDDLQREADLDVNGAPKPSIPVSKDFQPLDSDAGIKASLDGNTPAQTQKIYGIKSTLTQAKVDELNNSVNRAEEVAEQARQTVDAATGGTSLSSNKNQGTPDNSTGPKLSSHAALAVGALSGVGLTYALTRNRGQQSNAQLYGQQPLY